MIITTDLNYSIVEFLLSKGIQTKITIDTITINRTSMCNFSECKNLWEGDCYDYVLKMIRDKFSTSELYITWAGKTDDDYFLNIYKK